MLRTSALKLQTSTAWAERTGFFSSEYSSVDDMSACVRLVAGAVGIVLTQGELLFTEIICPSGSYWIRRFKTLLSLSLALLFFRSVRNISGGWG